MKTKLIALSLLPFVFFFSKAYAYTHHHFSVLHCSATDFIDDQNMLLPECLITQSKASGDIKFAFYGEPTTRYGHGILGDAIEAGSLYVIDHNQQKYDIKLPKSEVFEDLFPRIVDLDGDGRSEVIAIRASLRAGAAVTIYGLEKGQLIEKASTKFHGRANRWLNIAGFGDFRGTGQLEIAFVRTPHIGGTLYFYEYNRGQFAEVAQVRGFSNHAIGSRELGLSAVGDFDRDGIDEIMVPSDNRQIMRFVQINRKRAEEYRRVELPSQLSKSIETKQTGSGLVFKLGLRDSSIVDLAAN